MKRRGALPSVGLVLLLAGAAFLVYRQLLAPRAPGELGFFYDVSAGRIFTAARTAPPPIRGIDGPEEDGFRAVVVSGTGKPADRASWRVAYLEKFSPELKQKTLAAQASGTALEMGRMEMQAHRFVRRPEDPIWHALDTPEAEDVINSWARPGPDGTMPALCTP